MSLQRFQRLLLLSCLIAIGFGHAVGSGALVVCRDAHGGARIESGCEKTNAGERLRADEGRGVLGGRSSHRCDDTPVQDQLTTARWPTRSSYPALVPAAPAIASIPPRPGATAEPAAPASAPRRGQPPDSLRRLRSVVILV